MFCLPVLPCCTSAQRFAFRFRLIPIKFRKSAPFALVPAASLPCARVLSKGSPDASSSYNKVSLCNFAFLYHIQSEQLIQHLSDIIQHYFQLLFYLPHIHCLFIDYKLFSSSLYCALSTIHLVSASALRHGTLP